MKDYSDSKRKNTEEDIIKMLEFLVDNICVVFARKVFQQTIGIVTLQFVIITQFVIHYKLR